MLKLNQISPNYLPAIFVFALHRVDVAKDTKYYSLPTTS